MLHFCVLLAVQYVSSSDLTDLEGVGRLGSGLEYVEHLKRSAGFQLPEGKLGGSDGAGGTTTATEIFQLVNAATQTMTRMMELNFAATQTAEEMQGLIKALTTTAAKLINKEEEGGGKNEEPLKPITTEAPVLPFGSISTTIIQQAEGSRPEPTADTDTASDGYVTVGPSREEVTSQEALPPPTTVPYTPPVTELEPHPHHSYEEHLPFMNSEGSPFQTLPPGTSEPDSENELVSEFIFQPLLQTEPEAYDESTPQAPLPPQTTTEPNLPPKSTESNLPPKSTESNLPPKSTESNLPESTTEVDAIPSEFGQTTFHQWPKHTTELNIPFEEEETTERSELGYITDAATDSISTGNVLVDLPKASEAEIPFLPWNLEAATQKHTEIPRKESTTEVSTPPKSAANTTPFQRPDDMYTNHCTKLRHFNLDPSCTQFLFDNLHREMRGWKPCKKFRGIYPSRYSGCGSYDAKCRRTKSNKHCCRSVHCYGQGLGLRLG